MTYIIPISIILIYSTILSTILKKRIEQTIPVSTLFMIIIIYITGMFDNLKLGVTIIRVISIIGLIIALSLLCKEKDKKVIKEKMKNIITPGAIIYIILSTLMIVINKGRKFDDIDEFNHWGKIIKNMFLFNTYGTNENSIITFNEYPPLTAIFEYIFLTVKNVYSEDIIITANNILYISIIVPITEKIEWNKGLKNLLVIVPSIIFIPMLFYPNFYLNILVDGLLGVMFGMCIFYSCKKDTSVLKSINIFSMLTMMTLTKTTGIALAVVAFIIIFIKNICEKDKKEIIKSIIIIILVTLVTSTWYIKANGAKKRWDFEKYVQSNEEKDDTYRNEFLKVIFESTCIAEGKVSIFGSTCIIICIGFLVDKKLKEKNCNGRYYIISIFISIIIYMIALYVSYITIFEKIEADVFACFDRYSSTILLAGIIFEFAVLTDCVIEINLKKGFIIFTMFLVMFPYQNFSEKYIKHKGSIIKTNINRTSYTGIAKYKSVLNEDDKILFITGNAVDKEYLITINEYEMMPIKITDFTDGNFGTKEQFNNIVGKYDFVFVYRYKEQIENIIEKELQQDTLYKINYENSEVELQMVEK